MKKFLFAFGIILALAVSVTAATSNFNQTHETIVSSTTDGDCDKCGKKDCKGDCSATKKACTKSKGKSCCKKGDATAAKSCCKKGTSKKACTGKKECKKAKTTSTEGEIK